MGKIALLLACLLVISLLFTETASAQQLQPVIDFWRTEQGCRAAEGAPFYYPTKPRVCPLTPGEKVVGNPEEGCFLMDLPDRDTKRVGRDDGKAWVRLGKDRRMVARTTIDGRLELLRLEECCNQLFEQSSILTVPVDEPDPGIPGINCWDLNQNRLNDPEEDTNRDGMFDPRDCQGSPGTPASSNPIRIPEYKPAPPNPLTNTNKITIERDNGSNKGLLLGAVGGTIAGAVLYAIFGRNRGGGVSVTTNNFVNRDHAPTETVVIPSPQPSPIGVPFPPTAPSGGSSSGGTTGTSGASPLPPCPSCPR